MLRINHVPLQNSALHSWNVLSWRYHCIAARKIHRSVVVVGSWWDYLTFLYSGPSNTNIHLYGKQITVRGWSQSSSVIDCANTPGCSAFVLMHNETSLSTIANLTIVRGMYSTVCRVVDVIVVCCSHSSGHSHTGVKLLCVIRYDCKLHQRRQRR